MYIKDMYLNVDSLFISANAESGDRSDENMTMASEA